MPRPCLLLLLVGVGASVGMSARASRASDLGADVKALSAARAAYGRLVHLKPRLLEHGERLPLAVPAEQHDEPIERRRYLGLDVLGRSRMNIVPHTHTGQAPSR